MEYTEQDIKNYIGRNYRFYQTAWRDEENFLVTFNRAAAFLPFVWLFFRNQYKVAFKLIGIMFFCRLLFWVGALVGVPSVIGNIPMWLFAIVSFIYLLRRGNRILLRAFKKQKLGESTPRLSWFIKYPLLLAVGVLYHLFNFFCFAVVYYQIHLKPLHVKEKFHIAFFHTTLYPLADGRSFRVSAPYVGDELTYWPAVYSKDFKVIWQKKYPDFINERFCSTISKNNIVYSLHQVSRSTNGKADYVLHGITSMGKQVLNEKFRFGHWFSMSMKNDRLLFSKMSVRGADLFLQTIRYNIKMKKFEFTRWRFVGKTRRSDYIIGFCDNKISYFIFSKIENKNRIRLNILSPAGEFLHKGTLDGIDFSEIVWKGRTKLYAFSKMDCIFYNTKNKIYSWNMKGENIAQYVYSKKRPEGSIRVLSAGQVLISGYKSNGRGERYLTLTLLSRKLKPIFYKIYPGLGTGTAMLHGHIERKDGIDIFYNLFGGFGFGYAAFRVNKKGEPQPLLSFSECFDYSRFTRLYSF